MPQIYTAGYSGHTPQQLLAAANALNAIVVDVRFSPFSRVPGWSDKELKFLLGERYHHIVALGNVNHSNEQQMQLLNEQLGLDCIEGMAKCISLILLCGCPCYDSCHRKLIHELLLQRGITTQELAWPEIENPGILKALSIRQPWAWLIINGGKDFENRTWATQYRGPVLIHAAKGMTPKEYAEASDWADFCGVSVPPINELQRGGIIGAADIVDCVDDAESNWFFGPYGFKLANPRPLPFVPYRGALGFFNVPMELVEGTS